MEQQNINKPTQSPRMNFLESISDSTPLSEQQSDVESPNTPLFRSRLRKPRQIQFDSPVESNVSPLVLDQNLNSCVDYLVATDALKDSPHRLSIKEKDINQPKEQRRDISAVVEDFDVEEIEKFSLSKQTNLNSSKNVNVEDSKATTQKEKTQLQVLAPTSDKSFSADSINSQNDLELNEGFSRDAVQIGLQNDRHLDVSKDGQQEAATFEQRPPRATLSSNEEYISDNSTDDQEHLQVNDAKVKDQDSSFHYANCSCPSMKDQRKDAHLSSQDLSTCKGNLDLDSSTGNRDDVESNDDILPEFDHRNSSTDDTQQAEQINESDASDYLESSQHSINQKNNMFAGGLLLFSLIIMFAFIYLVLMPPPPVSHGKRWV